MAASSRLFIPCGHTYPDRISLWFFLFRKEKELNREPCSLWSCPKRTVENHHGFQPYLPASARFLFGSFSFTKEKELHRVTALWGCPKKEVEVISGGRCNDYSFVTATPTLPFFSLILSLFKEKVFNRGPLPFPFSLFSSNPSSRPRLSLFASQLRESGLHSCKLGAKHQHIRQFAFPLSARESGLRSCKLAGEKQRIRQIALEGSVAPLQT